jgi:hypothetical protein
VILDSSVRLPADLEDWLPINICEEIDVQLMDCVSEKERRNGSSDEVSTMGSTF